MELRFQLVPRRGIDKAKRAVAAEAERAAERLAARRSRPRLVNQEAEESNSASPATIEAPPLTRRARTPRVAKAVGGK